MSIRRLAKDVIVHAPIKAVVKKVSGKGFSLMSVGKDSGYFGAADALYMFTPLESWISRGIFKVSGYGQSPVISTTTKTLSVGLLEILMRMIGSRSKAGIKSIFSMSNIIEVFGSDAVTFGIRDMTEVGKTFSSILDYDDQSPRVEYDGPSPKIGIQGQPNPFTSTAGANTTQ